MKLRTAVATAVSSLSIAVAASGMIAANASTQIVDASIGTSVSMTTSPSGSVDLGSLPAIGNTTLSAGSMVVQTNSLLGATVTVQGLKSSLTKFDGVSTYDDTVKLAGPLSVATTSSDVGALPVPVAVVTNLAATPIAAPLLPGTYTYALSISQPTLVTDAPGSYRNVLTYTAAPVLP